MTTKLEPATSALLTWNTNCKHCTMTCQGWHCPLFNSRNADLSAHLDPADIRRQLLLTCKCGLWKNSHCTRCSGLHEALAAQKYLTSIDSLTAIMRDATLVQGDAGSSNAENSTDYTHSSMADVEKAQQMESQQPTDHDHTAMDID